MRSPAAAPGADAAPGSPREAFPFSPTRLLVLVVLAVGVAQGFGRFTYAVVLPAIDRDFLHSYSLAGWLGSANLAAYLVGTLFVSLASSVAESATLIRAGLFVVTGGLVAMTLAPNPLVLGVGMIATGLGGAFVWIPAPALAGSVVSEERRGSAIGLMASGIGVSMIFASQLTRVVHGLRGPNAWREVWAVELAIAMVTAVLVLGWLREPPIRPGEGPRESTLRDTLALVALRGVPHWVALTAAYAGYGLCYSIYSNYLVAALEDDAGFGAAHAAFDYALVGLAVTAGGVLLGRLSDRIGRRATMVLGFVAMGTCPLLVRTGAEPWVGVSAVTFGLTMSGLGSVVAAYVRDYTSEGTFAPAFGAITLFFGAAQLVGPELGGILAEHTGSFALAFLVSALSAFSAALASALLPRPRR